MKNLVILFHKTNFCQVPVGLFVPLLFYIKSVFFFLGHPQCTKFFQLEKFSSDRTKFGMELLIVNDYCRAIPMNNKNTFPLGLTMFTLYISHKSRWQIWNLLIYVSKTFNRTINKVQRNLLTTQLSTVLDIKIPPLSFKLPKFQA